MVLKYSNNLSSIGSSCMINAFKKEREERETERVRERIFRLQALVDEGDVPEYGMFCYLHTLQCRI